jgi:hypothetical protein
MPAKKKASISPEQFPALREFLRGYFHQDLEDEYGSPQAAARQFWQDADQDQRKAVAEEWSKLLDGTKQFSLDQTNQLLQKIGSAWTFDTREEIQDIGKIFRP